jgi:Ca-activated chloride channel family protein
MRHSPPPLLRLAALLALLAPSPVVAGASDAPAAVIVLDGSGSMWGKLDGEGVKFQAARDALQRTLPQLGPEAAVGLVAFGHRRKSDCGDVELLVPPRQKAAEAIGAALERVTPVGKGPLVSALREAVRAIGARRPASVILMHDAADNCQQDPCAAAAEIAKSQPGLRVHVIGIALEPEDARGLSCLAKATEGRSFNARDAASLATSLAEAMTLAMQAPPVTSSAAAPSAPRSGSEGQAPLPSRIPTAGPALLLSAHLSAAGDPIAQPVRWRITREGAERPIADAKGLSVVEGLASGRYTVEARVGLAAARETVDVTAQGPTSVRIALEAGLLKLSARALRDSDSLTGAVLSLRTAGGPAEPLWISRASAPELVVPSGSYVARAELGLARRDQAVVVVPGSVQPVEIVLGSGRLELAAVTHEGGEPLDEVVFALFEDDPEAPGGRREVVRSAAPRPDFELPAGTYYVSARHGSAEVSQTVAVGAGDTVKRTIALGLARVTISASAESGPATPVVYRVTRLDGPAREVVRSTSGPTELLLPAGRFRIAARRGAQNVRAERDIELKPGRPAQVALPLSAGEIALRLAGDLAAHTPGDLLWDVRDARGHSVWRTGQAEPKALLLPGRYLARAELRDRRLEKAFEIKAGERRALELGAE